MTLSPKNILVRSFLAIFISIVIAGFLFYTKTQTAYATGICTYRPKDGGALTQAIKETVPDKAACESLWKEKGDPLEPWFFNDNSDIGTYRIFNPNAPLSDKSGSGGGKDVCNWESWGSHPINCSLSATLQFVGGLLPVSSTVFSWGADTNSLREVIDGPAIYPTWQKVRDILNIFFIIILLFSAFATIFQVEQYNYKKILLTLVIMALLVNFSFPITRFIIDVSNTMMYTIIQNLLPNKEATFAVITENSGITSILNPAADKVSASYLLSAIIFVFILAITLMAISALLIIRMIALAILIIFSPIAFVGSILPGAGKYSGEWWDKLFKYSFFGPIMLFMVYVAVVMMNTMASQQAFKIFSEAKNQTVEPTIVGSIAYFFIPIIILWMGIGIAQGMSITGASAVMGQAQKFMGWAGKTFSGYRAGKWFATKAVPGIAKHGAEKFEESVLAPRGLSPRAFIKGWKARSAESERKALEPAAGDWHDRLNRWISGGDNKTRFGDTSRQANVAKKRKELSETSQSSEYLYSEFENAEKRGDAETMSAVLGIMFNNNDQNEFMKLAKKPVDPFEMKNEIYTRLVKAGMKPEQAAKQMSDLSEIAVSKGNFANYGMAWFNPKTHQYELMDDAHQPGAAAAKASNIKAQTKADLWHWNSIVQEIPDLDPKTGEFLNTSHVGNIHKVGESILNSITMSEVGQLSRVRKDFVDKLSLKLDEINKHAKKVGGEQEKVIEAFAAKIKELKFAKDKASEKPKTETVKATNAGLSGVREINPEDLK